MNCLVLGGAGFIGSHLVDALVGRGHRVRVFDLPNISMENLDRSLPSVEILGGDFENRRMVAEALEGMEAVVHLVSTTLPGPSNENPGYDVETNVIGSIHLLEEAVRRGARKVVFASSGGTVYGVPEILPIPESHGTNPICSYGITKLAVEKYLTLFHHLHGLRRTVLRLANPYGERQRTNSVQGAVAVFLGRVLRNEEITIWGDGTVARDYFHVSDLARALLLAVENDLPSPVYNVGSGTATSLLEILGTIGAVTGRRPEVRFTPARKLDVPVNCLDIRKIRSEGGWAPMVSLEEGIARTWEWMKSKGR
jgi:UDP-glucose 4-epimerase